jgi:hypothetical protein
MSVMISFSGPAYQVLSEMEVFLKGAAILAPPAVSDSSSDNEPKTGVQQSAEQPAPVVEAPAPKRGRKPKVVATAVPTGEPLYTPDEPSPPLVELPGGQSGTEEAAQDAADEYAEDVGPVGLDGAIIYTLDDVRNSALPYITKWGKEAAAKDLVPIVMAAGGVPNIGKLDPANQELLKKVMQAFADAAEADKRFEA